MTDTYINDPVFKFRNSMAFSFHVDIKCYKVMKILIFVIRLNKKFSLNNTVKTFYRSLVRPSLVYDSLIWDQHTVNGSSQVERV